MHRTVLMACLLLLAPASRSAEPLSPIESYRRLEVPPKEENCLHHAPVGPGRSRVGDCLRRFSACLAVGELDRKLSALVCNRPKWNPHVRLETDVRDADGLSRRRRSCDQGAGKSRDVAIQISL